MKFAFDCDGVITEAPTFFAAVTKALRASGHAVYVITDFDEYFRDQREKELQDLGIEYDQLVIIGDKEGYCRSNGIDFAVDDEASGYFATDRRTRIEIVDLGS